MLGNRTRHRSPLEFAECRLAVVDEDVGDRLAGNRLDVGVGVAQLDLPTGRELCADSRLARTHRADEHHARPTDVGRRDRYCVVRHRHRYLMAARYASWLRFVSPTESPPNFSSTASASTSATIASATTAAAGTAHTSDRW